MKKVFSTALAAIIVLLGTSVAKAQSPDQQFGFGFTAGQALGGHLVYAISPAIHIGTGVGLRIQDGSNEFHLTPYGKFLFAGSKELKPYIIAQFGLATGGGTTRTGLGAGFGGEYFITPNFGLFGQIGVINIQFDPSVTTFGLLEPTVGVEWFFGK